jgi:hypothetical protein
MGKEQSSIETVLQQIMQRLDELEANITMPNFLHNMEWNANGLLQHKDELKAVLCTENIDICLISETHFTSESHIKFRNCVIYHTIHPANTARSIVLYLFSVQNIHEKDTEHCQNSAFR